jgi:hypothetical protein
MTFHPNEVSKCDVFESTAKECTIGIIFDNTNVLNNEILFLFYFSFTLDISPK